MKIILSVLSDHPLTIACYKINGFFRPLFGELANVTVVCSYVSVLAEWLESPPLGTTCTVFVDDKAILTGVLYDVSLASNYIELRIET